MARIFDITVSASLEDRSLLTRILDFKEDLYRECIRADYLSVSDPDAIDRALAPVSFSVRSKPGLARFKQLVQKSLKLHNVEQAVEVCERKAN
jgi:hypothetical protein